MEVIYFTKFLKGLSAEEIGEAAKGLRFDGLDIALRAGHCVNPSNVREALPRAMEVWRGFGLSVPLATLEGNWVDPHKEEVEAIFEACGKAGVPYIKLGYWVWNPSHRYWDEVEKIRKALGEFEKLGQRHGVCSLVHTHSGPYYGANAAGAMLLTRGFDPRYIGVYLDPAHLAVDGEPLPLAIDIARDYLKMVGVKNVRYESAGNGENARWRTNWSFLSQGLVNWPEAIRLFTEAGYNGPFSVHGEYSASEETQEVLKLVAEDMAYMRSHLS